MAWRLPSSFLRCVRGGAARAALLCTQAEASSQKVEVTDRRVQELLMRMTGLDLDRVFARRAEPLVLPRYRLLTEEQLKEEEERAAGQARRVLKMPPVLPERKERDQVLSHNERLCGLEENKIVFTDINNSISEHRERRIVVFEPSGTLREATWEERDRMRQVYFPALGRKMELPEVLAKKASLLRGLEQGWHLQILELANAQCEPDSPDYITVHHAVYQHIDKTGLYDALRSSRHFGGMVWYLVQELSVSGLMKDMLQRKLFNDAEDLVELCVLCHPEKLQLPDKSLSGFAVVEDFCKKNGLSSLLSQPSPTVSKQQASAQ